MIELYSRAVVDWSMKSTMVTKNVLDTLLMAVCRRLLLRLFITHSIQRNQFDSNDFARYCKEHQLVPSVSRRENIDGKALAESFISIQK